MGPEWGGYRMECSRVLDKSSKTIQYISLLYDIFTLGCSTFDLNENGTSSFIHTKKTNRNTVDSAMVLKIRVTVFIHWIILVAICALARCTVKFCKI